MTREVAKREIESLDYYLQNHTNDYSEESHTAMVMAIKALEQEPCEDAISRQTVLDAIEDDNRNGMWSCFVSDDDAQVFKDVIRQLPSFNPQPKMGHWIDDNGIYAWCSYCKEHIYQTGEFNYCPNCGCAMKGE